MQGIRECLQYIVLYILQKLFKLELQHCKKLQIDPFDKFGSSSVNQATVWLSPIDEFKIYYS